MWFTNFVKEDERRRTFNQQAFICVSVLHHRTAISDYILKAIGKLARNTFAVHYMSYHTKFDYVLVSGLHFGRQSSEQYTMLIFTK